MKYNDKTSSMERKIRRIHFVGIGGIGMSGIAEVLLNLGYEISGSDIAPSDTTGRLDDLGVAIHTGHAAKNIGNADVVVTSTAIRPENEEVIEAHRKNIPVIPRAEMLAELLKMKFSIAVSGSHGKTTTTSMVAAVLAHGGLDPTMVIGGKLASIGGNAKLGDGEVIVAEADESDGSFLTLNPCIAVITNIDKEHLDYYRNLKDIREAFLKFANIVPFYGATVLCVDDLNVRKIIPRIKRRFITYGIARDADYRVKDITFSGGSSIFSLYERNILLGTVKLRVPGTFNVYNSLAAVAAARELNIPFPVIKEGLRNFSGVHRRLEVKGKKNDVTVVDDYGHHPTEIKATLSAVRQIWSGRIIVVFQPHRYTRTQTLFHEFLTAFYHADILIITDIYAASEAPVPGVTAEKLCQEIKKSSKKDVRHFSNFDDIVDYLLRTARPSDVILTQGAGNVWTIGEKFLKRS